jgi:hypothetical protein
MHTETVTTGGQPFKVGQLVRGPCMRGTWKIIQVGFRRIRLVQVAID